MKEEKGITLIALILIIAIMLTLTGFTINIGMHSIDNIRIQGFFRELEIVQKRVDDIVDTNETYTIENNGVKTVVQLKTVGTDLTNTQKRLVKKIIQEKKLNLEANDFKYFTIEDLEDNLDLLNMNYNVFINFDKRVIIAENGIEVNNKRYYMLENTTYFVEEDNNKNVGNIESLIYNVSEYSTNKYRIIITPSNDIGDLKKDGYIKYKKTTTKYWETSTTLDFIAELDTQYNVIYVDSNNNTLEKVIKLEMKENKVTINEI